MEQTKVNAERAATAERNCRHHWLVEMAHGPTSRGRCRECGDERDFFNNPEDARIDAHLDDREAAGAGRFGR